MLVRHYLDPFTEFNTIRRQLSDVFGDLAAEAAPQVDWKPAIRLVERADAYQLTLRLAGVDSQTVDIEASRDTVVVSGERTAPTLAEGETLLYDDGAYGRFHRRIALPEAIQHDAVAAQVADGLLTLTLPKVVDARNRVVKVSLDNPTPAPDAGTAPSTPDNADPSAGA